MTMARRLPTRMNDRRLHNKLLQRRFHGFVPHAQSLDLMQGFAAGSPIWLLMVHDVIVLASVEPRHVARRSQRGGCELRSHRFVQLSQKSSTEQCGLSLSKWSGANV